MDGCLDVAERVMGIVRRERVQRNDAVQFKSHTSIRIHRPFEQIGLATPHGIERHQQIKARTAIELGGEIVGLQVLVESLAQHFLIEADAVEASPGCGRPPFDQSCDVLGQLEQCWQGWIQQLRRTQTGDRQCPGRWNDMRRDAAAQIYPLDFPERVVRQNRRKLQRLIEGGRDAGGFKIIKGECHERSLARGAESVIF